MTHIRSALAGAMLMFGAAAVASAQQQTPAAPTPQAQQHSSMHARGRAAKSADSARCSRASR